MIVRARWEGSPPQVGEYLMSQLRPRFGYRIDEVEPRVNGKLLLTVTRIAAAEVPAGVVIHPWKWDPRKKTGVAWSALS